MTTFFFQPGDIQETTCEWISWTSAECSLFKKKKKKMSIVLCALCNLGHWMMECEDLLYGIWGQRCSLVDAALNYRWNIKYHEHNHTRQHNSQGHGQKFVSGVALRACMHPSNPYNTVFPFLFLFFCQCIAFVCYLILDFYLKHWFAS